MAVTGITQGTFTKPMPMPDRSFIPPTGKSYKLTMATIGIWQDCYDRRTVILG